MDVLRVRGGGAVVVWEPSAARPEQVRVKDPSLGSAVKGRGEGRKWCQLGLKKMSARRQGETRVA